MDNCYKFEYRLMFDDSIPVILTSHIVEKQYYTDNILKELESKFLYNVLNVMIRGTGIYNWEKFVTGEFKGMNNNSL